MYGTERQGRIRRRQKNEIAEYIRRCPFSALTIFGLVQFLFYTLFVNFTPILTVILTAYFKYSAKSFFGLVLFLPCREKTFGDLVFRPCPFSAFSLFCLVVRCRGHPDNQILLSWARNPKSCQDKGHESVLNLSDRKSHWEWEKAETAVALVCSRNIHWQTKLTSTTRTISISTKTIATTYWTVAYNHDPMYNKKLTNFCS